LLFLFGTALVNVPAMEDALLNYLLFSKTTFSRQLLDQGQGSSSGPAADQFFDVFRMQMTGSDGIDPAQTEGMAAGSRPSISAMGWEILHGAIPSRDMPTAASYIGIAVTSPNEPIPALSGSDPSQKETVISTPPVESTATELPCEEKGFTGHRSMSNGDRGLPIPGAGVEEVTAGVGPTVASTSPEVETDLQEQAASVEILHFQSGPNGMSEKNRYGAARTNPGGGHSPPDAGTLELSPVQPNPSMSEDLVNTMKTTASLTSRDSFAQSSGEHTGESLDAPRAEQTPPIRQGTEEQARSLAAYAAAAMITDAGLRRYLGSTAVAQTAPTSLQIENAVPQKNKSAAGGMFRPITQETTIGESSQGDGGSTERNSSYGAINQEDYQSVDDDAPGRDWGPPKNAVLAHKGYEPHKIAFAPKGADDAATAKGPGMAPEKTSAEAGLQGKTDLISGDKDDLTILRSGNGGETLAHAREQHYIPAHGEQTRVANTPVEGEVAGRNDRTHLSGMLAEKIDKLVQDYNQNRTSGDMVMRLKVDGETMLLGMKDDGRRISVEIRTSNDGLTSFLQAEKGEIARQLEGRQVSVNIYVDPEGDRGNRGSDQRNQGKQGEERKVKGKANFLESMESAG
jgi:hypothetical protein